MAERHIIKLFGDITQETANRIYEQTLEIFEQNKTGETSPIYILINSSESNYDLAMSILNCLQLLPNKLIGSVIGVSGDATNKIFLKCDKRFAHKNSLFIFWEGYYLASNNFKQLKNDKKIELCLKANKTFQCLGYEIFESGLAEHKLTSFKQLFKNEEEEEEK